MKIRNAKISELKEIYEILNKNPELQGGTGSETYSKSWIKSAITDRKREIFLIAEEKGTIIGLLSAELWKNKKYSFIIDLFVKPDCRKRGIASALLKKYEEKCKNMGINKFIGLVLTSNRRMQAFMKKKNYKKGSEFYYYEKSV